MKKTLTFYICIMMAALLLTGCIFQHPPILGPAFVTDEPRELTVESIFAAASERRKAARTVSQKEIMRMDMSISMMGRDLGMALNAEISLDSQGDHHHMTTNMEVIASGVSQKQSIELYSMPGDIDEKVVVYQNTGSGWTKQSTESSPVDINKIQMILSPELSAKMTLQPETRQYYGKECHVVTGRVGWEDITSYVDLSKLTESMGENTEVDLSDLSFEVLYFFSVEDLSLYGTSMEGADSISEVFKRLLKATSGMDLSMEITEFIAESTLEYDVIDEVTVPEEVLNEAGGA